MGMTINPTNSNIKYSVGPLGVGLYQSIQLAINIAQADGGGTIFINPGTYTENILFVNGTVQLLGFNARSATPAAPGEVTIIGKHTPPSAGMLIARNIFFQSATDIFNTVVAGSALIYLDQCNVNITSGFTFNLPNWTGTLQQSLGEDISADNGIINNTGGASFIFQNSSSGTSVVNVMTTSGVVTITDAQINATWNAATGTVATVDRTIFTKAVNFLNNSAGKFSFCRFSTGSAAAYTHSTSGIVSIVSSIVDSSNNPAIAGAGAGALKVGDITFLNNAAFSPPPALTGEAGYMPGAFGTTGFVMTSNGSGVLPTFQTVSASGAVTSVNAGTGITITGTATAPIVNASGTTTLTYTNVNTTPYVVLSTDEYLSVDSSGGVRTVQLPNAATSGRAFIVKDRTGSAATNNITVTTVGGAVNIDGATTFVMNTAYQAIQVIGNGSTYEIF